jgi:hypothetical protein
MSLIYFTRSDANIQEILRGKLTQKEKRNIVYRVCGWTIIFSLVCLLIYFVSGNIQKWAGSFPVIFTFETIAVEAFGLSWITKGETLWPDGEHYVVKAFK